jgi:GntR family transcriptional regulator
VVVSRTQALIDEISTQIADGRLAAGDQLPTTKQLCTQHQVSCTVVRAAVLWLKARGLVQGLPGVGVFVVKPPPPAG